MSTFPEHASQLRRRELLLGGAAACMGVGHATAATPDLSRVTLRAATYKGLQQTLLQAAGLADTPYRIEWKELNSGVQHIEAINGGSLDFGSGSEIPPVFAARAKANVKVIAVYHEDLNNQAVFVPKGSPVQRIADLKGKRVGYTRATTSHYFLYKMLVDAGLTWADIQPAHLSPMDGLSAFARGDLDAWAIWSYNGQLARTQCGGRTLKTAVGYLSGNFLYYGAPDALADPLRHAALGDLLLRLQKAFVWSNANYLDYARAQARETRVPVGDIIELFNNRSQDPAVLPGSLAAIRSHQEVADTFVKIGAIEGPVNVEPLWDRSFEPLLRRGAPAAAASINPARSTT